MLFGEKWEREEHERACELYHSHITPQVTLLHTHIHIQVRVSDPKIENLLEFF